MPESLGLRLRRQRERQQIALATIAEQTKIKLSLLEELEHDDVCHWPTGIFRRAFIRAYAHAIGLDQDAIVREFLELYPDPIELVETDPAVSPLVEEGSYRAAPPMRLRYLVGSAIESLARLGRGAVEKPGVEIRARFEAPPLEKPAPPLPRKSGTAIPEELAAPKTEEPDSHIAPAAASRVEAVVPPKTEVAQTAASQVEPAAPPKAEVAAAVASQAEPVAPPPDLLRIAALCTGFGRLTDTREAPPLLQELAALLEAVGLIVWAWDEEGAALKPALAYGYSDRVLAQLPRVRRDADNATAAAFRSGVTCVVRGADSSNGALAVPLIAPAGCVGVLAIEVKQGSEDCGPVRALASIVAAQLGRLFEPARAISAADLRLA